MTSIGLDISPRANSSGHQQIAAERPAVADIAQIGRQREDEKQSAEHVAPLGDPGHAFDVLRMDGKQRRHQGAGPQLAGHAPQHQKQADRRGGVQQRLVEMMPPGFRPKSWQSSMCESIASGYHSPNGPLVKARQMPAGQPRGDLAGCR